MKYLFILISLTISMFCRAQQEAVIPFDDAYKRKYTVTRISSEKPDIDGRLNEDLWQQQGVWTDTFVQVSPNERAETSSPTRAKIFYDDKYIYVGIYCKESEPEKMNRFIGNRDENNTGDLVSVAFDTYHDYRASPEFNINLGGNKTDLIVTDKLEGIRSWNAVWEARTQVNMADSSWTAEMQIPFSQLRYNQFSEEGIWGLHIRRIIRHKNETQNWSLIPVKNNGHVFSFGEMHGMNDLPKPRAIEILPYVMGKYSSEPKIEGSPYQKGSSWKGNAGLDAKLALSDYTLDLTINPDFGQVELDPSVMNLTVYETFYDEKRTFFLEGKHILDFNNGSDMMFYTRRIGAMPSYSPADIDQVNSFTSTADNVPIIGALKLTGTNKNGLTIGVVQSITARSSLKVTRDGVEDKEVVEPLTNYTVARVQKNWKGNSLLGGMITSVNRAFNDEPHLENRLVRNAYTAGIDFTQYFANRLYYIESKGMFSYLDGTKEAITRLQQNTTHLYQRITSNRYLGVDPNRTSLSGTGGYLTVGRKGNAKWTFAETFGWSSPGFDLNTIGYMKEADYLMNETEIAFRQTNPWKIFRSNTITLKQINKWDYGGRSLQNSATLQWKSMLLNSFEIDFTENYGWNFINPRKLYGGPGLRISPFLVSTLSLNTDKTKRIAVNAKYIWDYNVAGNQYHTIIPGITLRLGNQFLVSGDFTYETKGENLQYVATISNGGSNIPFAQDTYVMGHLRQNTYGLTLKVQMNVTPDISIQFYGAPYTSTGKYTDFKQATNTLARSYNDRFHVYGADEISYADGSYHVDRNGEQYSFKNPNFSFNEFRSNLVARWEYLPGSTLYLVWEHSMSNRDSRVISGWGDNLDRMFGLPASNVFMVKLNYWFNL
ncbi:DUF5916 domain-containing protein [Parabacteroides sp. PF5-9]|uniref:DUF5916 domain-containing protein n=1 Tax=Parabacteroides sp. PF5-9 TaxID=1742404 RepID=UPI0024742C0F|nr:DUF5916 domain-containing protein [Parabacteroides sp. PF5-9]MDH6358049.1 hypothetical protein [Parabacteroides sp. PF5-9]